MQLKWEYPADRTLTQKAVVRVISVKNGKTGLFGTSFLDLQNHPSFAGVRIDPKILNGQVIEVPSSGMVSKGDHIQFKTEEVFVKSLKKGDLIAIGIISKAATCIVPVPAEIDQSKITDWLKDFDCKNWEHHFFKN